MNKVPQWIRSRHTASKHDRLLQEPGAFRRLVEKQHPLASDYLAARQAFEQLPYAAKAGCRFFSAIDAFNYCLVSAPAIGIADSAGAWRPARLYIKETHADNQALCRQADHEAEAGWPDRDRYFLNYGEWLLYTADKGLAREARALNMLEASLLYPSPCFIEHTNDETFTAIRSFIGRRHAGRLMAPQTPHGMPLEALMAVLEEIQNGRDAWL